MEQLRQYLRGGIGNYVALIFFVGVAEQCSNEFLGTHFAIKELTDIATFVFGQLSIKHGIDSAFNSPKGVSPSIGG